MVTDRTLAGLPLMLEPSGGTASHAEHIVQYYERDSFLISTLADFVNAGLLRAERTIVLATEPHREALEDELKRRGVDVEAARAQGVYVASDAAETLSKFMVDGMPDDARFAGVVETLLGPRAQTQGHVRVFGEMVALLWAQGQRAAAIRLEDLWNDLQNTCAFSLFCAYPINEFRGESHGPPFVSICDAHTRVIPSESYAVPGASDQQLRSIALLQQRAMSLEIEVAARKEAERVLVRRERQLTDFLENAAEALHHVGPDGTILWANNTELELLGYSASEYIGHHIAEFHVDQDVIADILERLQRGERLSEYEARLRHKSGSVRHVAINSTAYWEDNRFIHTNCFTRDITERKRAEELRARFAAIVESSDDAIIGKTLDGTITSWNRSAEQIFGYTAAEAVGQHIFLLVPEERRSEYHDVLARLQRGEKIDHFQTERRAKDGRKIVVSLTVSPIKDSNGRIIGASKVARDITERKLAESALRESRETLRRTLEFDEAVMRNMGEGLYTVDSGGVATFLNPAAEHLLGWSRAELLGRKMHDVIHHQRRDGTPFPSEECAGLQVLRDGAILRNHEDVFIRKDGTFFDVVYSSAPIRSGGAIVGLVVVFRDVSAQKRMEAELFKNSKLESLGVLAGGIAHDFNNILMAIISNLALVKMTLGPQHEVLTRLTAAEKAVLRAQSLTQQLLTFSKGGQPVKRVVSIAQLVRESAGFALQGSNIRCDLSIPDDAGMAEVDDGQISQVIHNLVLNAQQAMPKGGTVLVKVANRVVGPEDGLPLAPGRYVSIQVRDYGTGIAPEHLSKIFDPFFTTKPKGSGLGLTTAYSIIKRHSGALLVDSKVGAGTTFSVYLPRTESPAASHALATTAASAAGRILFMDDDAQILESAAALLAQLGYEVECARDGEEALALFDRARHTGRPFDAVVLDLTVRGGMGGLETIKRLRDLDSQVKAIVSSGYSNDPVLADYAAYGFSGMVAKPYTVENLNRLLSEMTGPK